MRLTVAKVKVSIKYYKQLQGMISINDKELKKERSDPEQKKQAEHVFQHARPFFITRS